jgi:glutamyl-tRNA reductase
MLQSKDFFSSKPKQISKAIVKISNQIFGKTDDVEVASIGDEEMVEDISENLKKYSFKKFRTFDKSINDFFDEKKKKIIGEEKFLENYKKADIFLIGFKRGNKVFSKDLIIKLLNVRRQKPIFLIEGALPGNIDQSVSKLSNLFLFDLNDLEQFFSFFDKDKIIENESFLLEEIEKNENLNSFFRKLNLNLTQKKIFFDNLNAFLLKEDDVNFKKKIYNFFESFKE